MLQVAAKKRKKKNKVSLSIFRKHKGGKENITSQGWEKRQIICW